MVTENPRTSRDLSLWNINDKLLEILQKGFLFAFSLCSTIYLLSFFKTKDEGNGRINTIIHL